MKTQRLLVILIAVALLLVFAAVRGNGDPGLAAPLETDVFQGPIVGEAAVPAVSPRADSLAPAAAEPLLEREINPRHNPLQFEPDMGRRGTWDRTDLPTDPLTASSLNTGLTPGLDFSFEGVGNPLGCNGCSPPDINGDVGPNHYIQMVNATKVAIFNKAGAPLLAPFNLGSLWSSTTCTGNWGDPIVLYDPLADRWLLTQFNSSNQICAAVSQTPDPTGAYWLYNWNVGSFPDYFKFGVWPDAYYMSANENSYTAYAFDRVKMLAGQPATFQKFTGGTNLYLPADLDGLASPPNGAPNPFYTFKDNSFHGGADRIELRAFDVDWVTPGNTTFSVIASLNVAPFTYTVCGWFNFDCARQPGTSQRLDTISEWPMHRFPYRNFGSHQALVGAFVIGGGLGDVGAAIRWFELRNTGSNWTLFQEGTIDPGDGHDRYVPSIAMDAAGNIAIGYTVSSSSLEPGIRYATRLAGDPLGTFSPEAVLIAGGGSQTGSNRWGDYAAMGVDPSNDCTFWYTNEYYSSNSSSNWKTRIGVFTIPGCSGGGPTPTPTDTPAGPTSTPTPTATATSGGRNTPTPGPTATSGGRETPTPTPVPGDTIHVADLDGIGVSSGPNRWQATVTITVVDQDGAPFAGAIVSGSWSSGATGSGNCQTDGAGQCSITRFNIRNTSSSATFTVDNVSATGHAYDPGANTDPDGDSDGTVIVVDKP
ncbi:MAG TPA: Ig-like domain-containing protein [Anaerolineales bacterium]|nr:Ig-like domain-containing protein [Anaerolineales bacterium]